MRTTPLLLAATLLAAPVLGHHNDRAPTFDDAAGDAGAAAKWGDLTTGWLDETDADLLFEMDLAELPEAGPTVYAWFVVADVEGESFGWGAYFDVAPGEVGFIYGRWDRAANGPRGALEAGNGTFEPGAPGRIQASIPKGYIAAELGHALPDGATASNLLAASGQAVGGVLAVGVTVQDFDEAMGVDYRLATGAAPAQGWYWVNGTEPSQGDATAPPSGPPAQQTPATPLGLALLVVGAAALGRRRRA